MFTLKLYRRVNDQLVTKVLSVDHVTTMDIGNSKQGDKSRMLELWAHKTNQGGDYDAYFIGEAEPEMTALTSDNHFGWGLLENAAGNTTQHFRPAGYG